MRLLTTLYFALAVLVASGWCDQGHRHPLTDEEIGSVHFSTSCSGTVGTSFSRAVALLHSFQYEQARQGFTEISHQDQDCAMAQWGIAMSYYNGAADIVDIADGRDALQEAQRIAVANEKTTPRERAYIDALAEIYREDGRDRVAHAQAFEQKMRAVQQAYPRDSEAAIFHALTLSIVAPKTDKTFTNQRECGAILEPIFQKQPHHPGVAHYLIHCYDNPALAGKGLVAARAYAKIAPASAHAHHMPSHIFTRLGLWDESINSNLNSAALAAKAEKTSTGVEARQYRLHAMDYLEYAYLQSGRVTQAKAVLDTLESLRPVPGLTPICEYAIAAIPARYALELRNWKQAAELQVNPTSVPWVQATTWLAMGVGSARSGILDRAAKAAQMLSTLRSELASRNDPYWSDQVEVQRREVTAWIADQSSNVADALTTMRSAADLEETMDKDLVTPGAIVPAREMLAELLLLHNRPKESLAEYEAVLKLTPNRFSALYGAASAAEASGNTNAANGYFHKLTEVAVGDERSELATARKKVANAVENR
jgi:tetratricopeptide (TPR) repeat protein